MRLHHHVAISAGVGAAGFGLSGSWLFAAVSFCAGVLIDLDHVIDYWREHPWSFSPSHFFAVCEGMRLYKVYLWLHSIEFILIAGIIAFILRGDIAMGLFVGIATHLIVDMLGNPIKPLAYSFVYRMQKSFIMKEVFVLADNNHGHKRST